MAKQKVFLVDDDSDILVLNRDFLESEGYDVVTAASCAEALEKIKLHSFSCIVLDVMLPDGSAFDLAPKIKEYTDCPIIFLTAKDQQEDVINGFKVGADSSGGTSTNEEKLNTIFGIKKKTGGKN